MLIDEIEICFGYTSLGFKRDSNYSDNWVRNSLLFSHFRVSITEMETFQSPHAFARSSCPLFLCYPYRCLLCCLWLVLNAEQWQTLAQLERAVLCTVLSSGRELLPWIPAWAEDWGALSTCLPSGLTSVTGKANNECAASFISNVRLSHIFFVFYYRWPLPKRPGMARKTPLIRTSTTCSSCLSLATAVWGKHLFCFGMRMTPSHLRSSAQSASISK